MTAEGLDHRTRHQEEHQTENLTEQWQREALQPFVNDLISRNKELTLEFAREFTAVTGPSTETHPTSWLDDHDEKAVHPFSEQYQERELNHSESDIILSFKEAARHLDAIQTDQLAVTIVEAMSHRTNAIFSQQFPQYVEDFAAHHDRGNIPHPQSYNSLMKHAGDYYAEALGNTEQLLKESLKPNAEHPLDINTDSEPYPITWAVDALRVLEKDMERTAVRGQLPEFIEQINPDEGFFIAYRERGNALAELFSKDYTDTHPDQPLDPADPRYIEQFKQTAVDYLPGDVHNVADLVAHNYAVDKANNFMPKPNSIEELQQKYLQIRDTTYNSLTDNDPKG